MRTFTGIYNISNKPSVDSVLNVSFYNIILKTEISETIWNVENIAISTSSSHCIISFADGGIFTTTDLSLNDILLEYFPKSHLHSSPNKQFISPPILLFISLFVLLVLATTLFYYYGIPAIGNYAGKHIPVKMEERIGSEIFEKMKVAWKIDTERTKAINEFFKYFNDNKEYHFYITVVKENSVNAFALPGGNIVVYDEIIRRLNTPEELAALLAHESSHIAYRHTSRTLCTNLANYLFFSAILGDISGMAAILIQNADQIKTLTYNRDLETEADLKGLELMYRNKIDPKGMLRLMETLRNESQNRPDNMPEFLSTHPLPESRLKYITENIAMHKHTIKPDTVLQKLWDKIRLN